MRHDGGLLMALGAGLGLLVAIWGFLMPTQLLAPTSATAWTIGAAVSVAATAVLFVAGLVLAGTAAPRGLNAFLLIGSLIGILGTALAGCLLESQLLVALMAVCLVGWLLRVLTRRPSF